jgi:hypothetical protein
MHVELRAQSEGLYQYQKGRDASLTCSETRHLDDLRNDVMQEAKRGLREELLTRLWPAQFDDR